MVSVSFGFFAGLQAFKPKLSTKCQLTVLILMSIPFAGSTDCILLVELIEDQTAVLLMTWSSLGVVFCQQPDLLASE